MEDRTGYSQEFSMQQAMKLAASEQGKQLYKQLQEEHGALLESAMLQARSGNYDQIKKTLSMLLNSPEGKIILDQLRRQENG